MPVLRLANSFAGTGAPKNPHHPDICGLGPRHGELGELVDRYEQVSEVARALFEGSYHVEAPDHERPGDGDGLKLLCWQMSLPSVELASLTPADDLLCIS